MRSFKITDWSIQTICLAAGIVNAARNQDNLAYILSYMLVGGANLSSWFIHLCIPRHRQWHTGRAIYQLSLLVVLLLIVLPLPMEGTTVAVMYILSPSMALFYWCISLKETASLFDPEKNTIIPTPKTNGYEQ